MLPQRSISATIIHSKITWFTKRLIFFTTANVRRSDCPQPVVVNGCLRLITPKSETFAYFCEAYSRILELGETCSARSRLLSELAEGPMPPDECTDGAEYVDILRKAVAARNGWKRILDRCSPPKPTSYG